MKSLPGGPQFRASMNLIEDPQEQSRAVADFFDRLGQQIDRIPAVVPSHGETETASAEADA